MNFFKLFLVGTFLMPILVSIVIGILLFPAFLAHYYNNYFLLSYLPMFGLYFALEESK